VKKIYFLTLHRPNRSPSQRFRFEQYVSFLQQNGFETRHLFLLSPSDDKLFYSSNVLSKVWILIKSTFFLLKSYWSVELDSLVFVQRECYMLGTAFFEKLFASKCKLIFDFDDAIWLQNVSDANKKFSFLKNPNKTKEIIQVSRLVIAGNQYLANYAKQYNSNVHVIPTTIDTDYHKPSAEKKKNGELIIGWTGTHSTVKYIYLIMPVLQKIKAKYSNVLFKVICEDEFRIEELAITTTAWSSEREIEQLSDIDIGIMPLPDDEWTKGKCGFKGLQYMAMQAPAVMSSVGVNAEIIQHGVNGFLAHTDEEWFDILCQLIDSEVLRKTIGEAGRKTILEKYSVVANKDKYLSLLNSL
jgi:glycosyltransferase involved in cell wall biosynthesis